MKKKNLTCSVIVDMVIDVLVYIIVKYLFIIVLSFVTCLLKID